ncbi:S8 family serine peptidase [Actinomadura barringtoniae]|uniref:S8 family serine peptidase n=1 Tax=Actinomadura barringtoniae TaxID=1427535 RepID=A0A939P6W3_9ACTN|nr:S8 family serine peptidase [Actinomadura barringtoniae]MBO2446585.1 S8 family serine peptidase [Actinomadura barringtoniae]
MRFTRMTAGFASAVVCAASLVAASPAQGSAQASAKAAPVSPASKLDSTVLSTYAQGGTANVWVRMAAKADLSGAKKIKDRTARGRTVMNDLKSEADRSQSPVQKVLKAAGLTGRTYWATNAIYVPGLPESVARKIAAMQGVAEIRQSRTFQLPKPMPSKATAHSAANELPWGLTDIKADQVWSQTGRRGEGVVVASVDSGVQYDHPALVRQYRGNNGDGTFTNDYNWFDPAGICKEVAPCDNNEHGTHTMGTMVGDDGKGTQVGVAPGAKWIAAKGCETSGCSDTSLLASLQWMLAPTDHDNQNPDPAKRPDIVNNSWGSQPSNDPMFEDVQLAWAAAGIMGVWANGNDGPNCETSGAPGSRTVNYSVGAYGSDHKIASFSSRGPGQDGEVKPNLSAPGVAVRSSVPGGKYAELDGTSMATPHVAGAVALLWSARPEYQRDLAKTRELLNISAIDTPDTQCGGTPANNNVYGEGRLDALALVTMGTAGLGTLSGTVTDATTKQPMAGATVHAEGPMDRTFTTGADGKFTFRVSAGDYKLTTTAFGFQTGTATVTLSKDGSLTQNVSLTPAQRVNVTGKVTDGSGKGGGLPAKIVANDGDGHTWTTTASDDGAYTLPLVPNLSYKLTFTSTAPGYDPATREIKLGEAAQTLDVGLTVRLACDAKGYQVKRDGSVEAFGTGRLPKGWKVTNVDPRIPHYSYQPGWVFNDPGKRGNHTGGSGTFAVVDSLHTGAGHVQDTYLTSPSYNLSKRTKATIEFSNDLKPAINSTTSADVSLDGGRTWTNVWTAKGFPGATGPATQVIPIPQANGKSDVRYRLHYRGQLSGWWAVDDAFAGDRTCVVANS